MRRAATLLPLVLLVAAVPTQGQEKDAPSHDRPFFMPAAERDRLRALVQKDAWAKADHKRLRKAADGGDGYAAAFLYALDGDVKDAAIAQKWLLAKYGKTSYWVEQATKRLASDF